MTQNAHSVSRKARPKTKKAQLLSLLRRKSGATLEQLAKATSWQHHSVRAALTQLRHAGHIIQRKGRGKTGRYLVLGKPAEPVP